jgi:hypothetical protein
MSEIVTIKPKKNSKRFFSTARQFQKVSEADGTTRDQEAGAYNGERFPNSRQMFRPYWSFSKRRWVMEGFSTNSPELNTLAAKCKLKYPKGHPKVSQYIDEADLFDINDPFFNHINLFVRAKEGETTLDKSNPIDYAILLALQGNDQFQSGEKGSVLSSRTKYVITDNTTSNTAKKGDMNRKKEAFKLLDALKFDKKVKIAMSMELIVGPDVDPEDLDLVLFNAIEADKTRADGKTKTIDLFIGLCSISSEDLNIKHLIARAKKSGVLRKTQADGYLLFGNKIGRSLKEVESYFMNEDNSDIIGRTTDAVNEFENK